jgi:hypothetical protein
VPETAKSGTEESEEVAETERRANGEVDEMPRFLVVLLKKSDALSSVRVPPAPMNGTEP